MQAASVICLLICSDVFVLGFLLCFFVFSGVKSSSTAAEIYPPATPFVLRQNSIVVCLYFSRRLPTIQRTTAHLLLLKKKKERKRKQQNETKEYKIKKKKNLIIYISLYSKNERNTTRWGRPFVSAVLHNTHTPKIGDPFVGLMDEST